MSKSYTAVLSLPLIALFGCANTAEPGPEGLIQVTPDLLDFGEVARGAAVDGQVHVANVGGADLTVGWTYDSGQNAVEFEPDHVPAPGATITVTYTPLGEC